MGILIVICHPVVFRQSIVYFYSAIFYVNSLQLAMTPKERRNNLDALSDHEMIFFVLAGKKYRFAEMHPCIPLHFIGFGLIWNTLA